MAKHFMAINFGHIHFLNKYQELYLMNFMEEFNNLKNCSILLFNSKDPFQEIFELLLRFLISNY